MELGGPAVGLEGEAETHPPVLQEERTAFDIHSYGDRLAARFGSLGEWQSFASLVAGLPPFEVCRYMLASLQLVSVGGSSWGGDRRRGKGGPAAAPQSLLQPPSPCCSPQANDYTVEVAQDPGLEEAVDTVRLRLLTRERAHERFRTYVAPSACP